MIRAECHSDDFVFAVKFDATPWFEQASQEDILRLAGCDWGGLLADSVADFFDGKVGYEDIGDMFTYLAKVRGAGKECGFECNVHGEDVLNWAHENRHELLQLFTPERLEIIVDKTLSDIHPSVPAWDRHPTWSGEYQAAQHRAASAPTVKDNVILSIPREAWDLLLETLSLDARSSAFDRALREKISNAIKQITEIKGESQVTDRITVNLNVMDIDGAVVDGATADLTCEQISDIVDHAAQVALLYRKGVDTTDFLDVVANMEEALVVYDIIPEFEGAPGVCLEP